MTSPSTPCTVFLPDLPEETFGCLLDRHLERGCSGFRIQLSGRLKDDRVKLFLLVVQARRRGIGRLRVFLDTRKLWDGDVDRLVAHLRALAMPSAVVEVPVPHDDTGLLHRISRELGASAVVPPSPLPIAPAALAVPA